MHHRRFPLILALAAAVLVVPAPPAGSQAPAPKPTVIRIASLAPPGSSFVKVLKAWSRTLDKETEGRVELRVFSGGSEGSDRDLVKRMKAGKLDAAGVATTGLSMVAPELQVLTAPGLLTDDAQLDRAREKLDGQLQKLIEGGGFKLLAWGDGGKNRVFSSTEFASPADLAGKPGWAGKDNAVSLAYTKALGANPVKVGASGVFPGLKDGKLEVVPASAMAAVAFQWYTKLKYMSSGNFNIIVGGSIITKKKFNELSEADQQTLLNTANRAASKLDQIVGRDDARAYETLLGRGITAVDSSMNQAAWDAAAEKARERLVERGVFSKSLLKAVEAASK
ncbi:MAG: TRAP transporter substrate-binding protein DctP [Deltaproteobacteria bacterium]|nr:TRAP transporter substrate-binding protein DctP [Deltaproteobacteria bacterium]NND28920.1 TRAP transporter substrate-binding protein DctP [Myxococcales bacterium]MBT8464065.1 TRAP transporter substrate-binding protein DctP [Deltaproteobacteria bacterium]MBT8483339.1 TRAP transporter substrate-binding protein DctP [Deltaproteobacteria bacterium]NNK05926.1 TRAP transporter substrate-binding protein DctP [Myxococcales bacterium]